MSLISLVIVLIVVGLLLWLVSMLPLDATIQKIIRVVVIICIVLYLIQVFIGPLPDIHIGR